METSMETSMETVKSKNSVVVKETSPHTICGVCSKPYNDPRILPCLHSFCQHCLHHEIEKSGSQQVFKCPACERSMSIPMGGASDLPQNLHLGFEVEVAGYMSKIVSNDEVCCDECIDGRSGPAEVFCCTCYRFMCTFCHHHHQRHPKLSKHSMVELDQEGAKQLQITMKPREQLCSLHNYQLEVYCETCRCVICPQCILDGHKDHRSVPLSSVAKSHRDEMVGLANTTKVVVTKLTGAIDGNDRVIEQVEISKRNAILAINQAFEILQQTLEKRKKLLLSEVETISLSETTALILQKEQLEKIVEDIGHYTEVSSHILQTHTDYEVVALGGLVPTELQATLKRVQTMSLTPSHDGGITVSVQIEDLVRELSNFGHISDLSPNPSSSTWTSTSVAKVGTRFHVKVESNTSKGEGYPHGGIQVKGEMRPKSHDGAVVYGEVEGHRDGTYSITLTPQTAGPHQLVITMDGQHVQDSPHDLDVGSKRGYLTLCNAQKVIKCKSPYCVAVHDNGDVYVGHYDSCIFVFDQMSRQLKNTIHLSRSGCGEDEMLGIFIKGDVLYVADHENHCVHKLTSRGVFLHKFGQQGSDPGEFDGPNAVIVDSGDRLIVSDENNHRIQILDENGGWLLTIDGTCRCYWDPSWLQNPRALALDPQGNIHVASLDSDSIKVFTKEGVFARTYGDLQCPTGIAIDEEGYSFVTDDNCLSVFHPQGNKIHTVENQHKLWGAAVDPRDGSVYVADLKTETILKYSI